MWLLGEKPLNPYQAQFGNERELLSRKNKGFCLTGKWNLDLTLSYRNALIIGGTGSGKTSSVLLPSIYTTLGSFVIHDPSGELYTKSAGHLHRRGYRIKVVNFADPVNSDGYNPLIRAKSESEINKVAHLLISTTLKSDEPFWNLQAANLLGILIHLVKGGRFESLHNVRDLLTLMRIDSKKLTGMFEQVSPRIHQEYQAFLKLEDKVQSGVVATVLAALQLFTDQNVSLITSHDTLDFERIRREPTAIYLQSPVVESGYFQPLLSIFLEQLFRHLLAKLPGTHDQDVFFLIDEAASFQLPTLSNVLANIRKYRAGIMLVVQDQEQLIHRYGEAEARTMKSNCFSQLYFPGQSLQVGQELSQLLGLTKMESESESVIRPLITPDELRTLPKDQGILLCGNKAPLKVSLYPYFENKRFQIFSQIPPPQRIITHPKLTVLFP